jgi:cell division inhibitor SepF
VSSSSSSWFGQAEQHEGRRFWGHKASVGDLFGSPHQVGVVEPSGFEEGAQDLAKRFKRRQAIVLNLQQADEGLAKRMVDFCAGLAYGLEGTIRPIAPMLFLLSPAEMEVCTKEGSSIGGGKFYTQF